MTDAQASDVIVVGGGLAGGLAALALARAGFSVTLVDAQDPAVMRADAFDGRTTALAYGCARVFRRLGLWPAIAPEAEAILDILVTDGRARSRLSDGFSSPFHLHFDSRDLETGEPLGWIVENRILRAALYAAISAESGVVLAAPVGVAAAEFGPGAARIRLQDGRLFAAPLVIAADGRNSALRRQAGLRVNRWSYPQTGIVVTVAHERPHKGVAQEFFLPAGPFAILPMSQNRASLVWTERSDAAPAYLALDEAAFLREVENRFGDYLGGLRLAGPRWSYPLSFHLAQRFIAPRLALIGDAARAIHPIAGQGYNLGVKDVAALVETLADAASLGLDIGHGATLARYERWRRFDSTMLALGTDVLNRLFSNDFAPLRLARAAGMSAVGRVGALRRFFMRQAGADLGALPSLMRPEC